MAKIEKRYVITNTPSRLPIISTVLFTFLMDYYKVNDLWWGFYLVLMGLWWLICIAGKFNESWVDLNKPLTAESAKKDPKGMARKVIFATRIQELMDKAEEMKKNG